MANECTVRTSLSVDKGNLVYRPPMRVVRSTMSGTKGPTPGSITVAVAGTDVDLSALTSPGLCRMANQDTLNYVELGVWNPDQSEFYPLIRLNPGDEFVFRLSPLVNEEYSGTGTGTSGQLNTLRLKAANAPCQVLVEAFDA